MPRKDGKSAKRRKKSDKSRRHRELYGKYSQRGVRANILNIPKVSSPKKIRKSKGKSKK
jgi:hypothetical protein